MTTIAASFVYLGKTAHLHNSECAALKQDCSSAYRLLRHPRTIIAAIIALAMPIPLQYIGVKQRVKVFRTANEK